jgi:hypothetical protein
MIGVFLSGLCVACSAPEAGVRSTRADATTTTTTLPPLLPDAPSAVSFSAQPLLTLDAPPDLAIWPTQTGAEAAVHALAPAADGWLAVGSVTRPLAVGVAALWRVAADGTFGEPEVLPTNTPDQTGVARDVATTGTTTVVTGYVGAGTDASAVVWVRDGDGPWAFTPLATDVGALHGTITDDVLVLADGTIVVVGRGDGPFHSTLVLWWSMDFGITWDDFLPSGARSFLPPQVATDGSRIAMLLSDVPADDGLAAYDSAVITWNGFGLTLESIQYIDPTPGQRYWPEALLWDGTAFVGGFQTAGRPVLATSADGATYTVQEMDLPGAPTSLPTAVEGMVMVDGVLTVFIEQGVEVTAFRREGAVMTPLDLPYVVAGDLAYLEGHELLATDGHRVAYVAANWDSKVFLAWDGAAWATRDITEVPPHRNLDRFEVRDVVQTGDSKVALLSESVSESPGNFTPNTAGILWQPPGETSWMLPDVHSFIPNAGAVVAWKDNFVIAGLDFMANTTTLWRLDPRVGEFTEITTIDGRVKDFAGGADGLIARVTGASAASDSTVTVWASTDGSSWTEVPVPGHPAGLCSDGDTTAVVWAAASGDRDTVGVMRVDGLVATAVGTPVDLEPYQLATDFRSAGRCGVNTEGVVTIHVGYDGALANHTPVSRSLHWHDGLANPAGLLMSMNPIGSDEAMVNDVEWTGSEWVAVGFGYDAERSMDAMLWRSADGLVWERGETIAGGPGNQHAWSVLVNGGQLIISGFDVQQGKIWLVAA